MWQVQVQPAQISQLIHFERISPRKEFDPHGEREKIFVT